MVGIKFKRDTAFRKLSFMPDSFAHPAKMDAQLLLWIVDRYTKVGETILDPMAGSGTSMLACPMGRNVVLVDLEEKFCQMMRDNWGKVRMQAQLGYEMGDCRIVQGDARNLEGLVVDGIISSPPYSDMSMGGGLNTKPPREGHDDQSGRSPSTPSQEGAGHYVDKIVTSPPYAEAHDRGNLGVGDGDRADLRAYSWLKEDNPANIGNLPYGYIDSIITSPPYEGSIQGEPGIDWTRMEGGKRDQSKEPAQQRRVASLSGYDAVITSPPYEGSLDAHHGHSQPDREKEFEKLRSLGYKINPGSADNKVRGADYSDSMKNIGNLKADSYLEAMLQVYQQCHTILKPTGLMILVTKNFIREKAIVRLDTDTIKLCEQAGFSFVERHYRELPAQSFWRVIYHKKYPNVDQIKHEDVLVFSK